MGLVIDVVKGLPLSGGQGGSAASAAAAAVAVNALLGSPLPKADLLGACLAAEEAVAGRHADNVAAALFGGVILVRSLDPLDVVALPYPDDLLVVLVAPEQRLRTEEARAALPATVERGLALAQAAQVGAIVAALASRNYSLLSRSVVDRIAEPARAPLLPGFYRGEGGGARSRRARLLDLGGGPGRLRVREGQGERQLHRRGDDRRLREPRRGGPGARLPDRRARRPRAGAECRERRGAAREAAHVAALRRVRAGAVGLFAGEPVPRLRRVARGPASAAAPPRAGKGAARPLRGPPRSRSARRLRSLEIPRAGAPGGAARRGRDVSGREHAASLPRGGVAIRGSRGSSPEARGDEPDRLLQRPRHDRRNDAGAADQGPRGRVRLDGKHIGVARGLRLERRASRARLRPGGPGRARQARADPRLRREDPPRARRLRRLFRARPRGGREAERLSLELRQSVSHRGAEDDRARDAGAALVRASRLDRAARGEPRQHVRLRQGAQGGERARPDRADAAPRVHPGRRRQSFRARLPRGLRAAAPREGGHDRDRDQDRRSRRRWIEPPRPSA